MQAAPRKPAIWFYNFKIWIKDALKMEEPHNNYCYLDVVERTTIPNCDWLIVMGDYKNCNCKNGWYVENVF
jgi:hypothetical protein